eukprot:SAG11_NODE_1940_length_4027_cov_4.230652_4_plen_398_part_01
MSHPADHVAPFIGWQSIDKRISAQNKAPSFMSWEEVPTTGEDIDLLFHERRMSAQESRRSIAQRNPACNKRSRLQASVAANNATIQYIEQAAQGHMICKCTTGNCGVRVCKEVPADQLIHKLTWRHKSSTSETDVAAALIAEIRAFQRAEQEYVANIHGVPTCLYGHAYFNGLMSAKKKRPSRTHRRYLARAKEPDKVPVASHRRDLGDLKRRHASLWIQDRITTTGQTWPVMGRDSGRDGIVTDASGKVISTSFEYRIRPPIITGKTGEHARYVKDSADAGKDLIAGKDLFRDVWHDVVKNKLNVRYDTFNNVTADCFECVHWSNMIQKCRAAGGSHSAELKAAMLSKREHDDVIRDGYRGGAELFEARARAHGSDWCALEFDGTLRKMQIGDQFEQ